jgi:hypothetical protein
MTTTISTRAAALGVGLALTLTLALTGCGPSVTPIPGSPDTSTGSGESDGSATVSLPDGFPSDEVPIIDGTLVEATHAGNIWAVWVASNDLVAGMAAATQLLVDAGYESVLATPEYSDFHGSKWQVHVTAADDATYGSTIAYSFYLVQ